MYFFLTKKYHTTLGTFSYWYFFLYPDGKRGQKPRRINTWRELRQGQAQGERTVPTVRANDPTQVTHNVLEKREGEVPWTPNTGVKGKKCPFGQCVTNIILMSEYEYEYIWVDFFCEYEYKYIWIQFFRQIQV